MKHLKFCSPALGLYTVLSLAVICLCPDRAAAVLLEYEGFDYTAGTSVAAQNGGTGWTNAWATGGNNVVGTNVAGSLGYTDVNGLSLQTTGGSLVAGNPVATTGSAATPNRALNNNLSGGAGTVAGPGGTVWISFLYKRLNFALGTLPFSRQSTFSLFEGSGERVPIGSPNTSATVSNVFSVWSTGAHNVNAPFQAPNYPITSNTTYFVLMKVVTDGTPTADNAYIWVNWTNLVIEPDIATATILENEINLSSINTLRVQASGQNANGSNSVCQVDEIRVGTTFDDVTPEVGTLIGPSITFPPVNQTVTIGETAQLSVTASGSVPLYYRWYFNTNTLVGSNTNQLVFSSVTTNHAGEYFVVVSNSVNSITSAVATLTVVPPVAPGITTQPASLSLTVGDPALFSVTATGTAPLHYQWYFNTNTVMSGQTNPLLSFTAQTNDAGKYSVIITNNYGAITSAVAALTIIPAFELLPAFPGADGAAKYVTGGRGGVVYHVTKLDKSYNDNSPGTLRYGLANVSGPRTIVFDVAGVFWLGRYGAESNHNNGWDVNSRYNLSGNTTIAGQTAPGPVIIMGGGVKGSAANIIFRNVTIAPGYGMRSFDEPPVPPTIGDFPDSYVYDAVDCSGQNIMLDHLTTLYITDEAISCNEFANNLTVQYCNVSQGQNYPQADAESSSVSYTGHALAHLLQAGSNAKISVLHNLYAHQKGRLPRVGSEVGTGAINDFRNNVFYNWLGTAGSGASGQPSFNNFINNFYLAGPGGDNPVGGSNSNLTTSAGGTGIFSGSDSTLTRVFHTGNLKDTNKDGDPYDGSALANSDFGSSAFQSPAYNVSIGVTLSAPESFTNVLRYVGSRWWDRPYNFILGNTGAITTNDIGAYVDERLIRETVTGTGKIMAWADDPFDNNPNEGTEWRNLLALRADPVTGAAPFNRPANWDTDGDGLPDAWESEHGLNPNVANNNADFDTDGYTDLEEYLNELAAWPAPGVIVFNNTTNNRYAEIFNWSVSGVTLNVAGLGTAETVSRWQPSRYDTALISNRTCFVDAVGQCAGTLRLTNSAVLNITNGWLSIADKLEIAAGCVVQSSAGLRVTNSLVNRGTLRLTGNASLWVGGSFTNTGVLDALTWNGTLPPGLVNTGTILDRSLIKITAFQINGTNFQVTVQGYTGHNFQLQYCDNPATGAWQNLGASIPGTGAPINLGHPGGAASQQRFYRVAVNP